MHSVNLGTGENGMHPDFKAILAYLRTRPIKLTITSNGHSSAVLSDDELRAFHDVEFSLDYPTQAEQDAQRGAGNWELIQQQAERCVRLGIPVTIIAVMMKANCLRLADVARVAESEPPSSPPKLATRARRPLERTTTFRRPKRPRQRR